MNSLFKIIPLFLIVLSYQYKPSTSSTCNSISISNNGTNILYNGSIMESSCIESCGFQPEEAEDENKNFKDNVGLAFGLVTIAGLSTSIGAALVFFDKFVTKTNDKVLAASLGFSGGVMLYVSFAEILQKSVGAFTDCNCLWDHDDPSAPATIMATIMFFCGIILYLLLDALVHCIMPGIVVVKKRKCKNNTDQVEMASSSEVNSSVSADNIQTENDVNTVNTASSFKLNEKNDDINELGLQDVSSNDNIRSENVEIKLNSCVDDGHEEHQRVDLTTMTEEEKASALNRMGMMTALAIGLHNFPEGLATFAATLADPSVGAALTVAIAIHNIPEGLCVSIPIYYATESRWRGFIIASLSGVAELVGAALGYGFLMSVFDDSAYAILFGLVAGMMVAIVISELIPTGLKYSGSGKVFKFSFIAGMVVMAFSLVLFLV